MEQFSGLMKCPSLPVIKKGGGGVEIFLNFIPFFFPLSALADPGFGEPRLGYFKK